MDFDKMDFDKIDFDKMYFEEDNFPRKIASYEMREWGILFYDQDNPLSRDCNHALIYKKKIKDFGKVLEEIVQFYQEKGITPSFCLSVTDKGSFGKITEVLDVKNFAYTIETRGFAILRDVNILEPNEQIVVKQVTEWSDDFATEIFHKADKPWEMPITKKSLQNPNTLLFVAYLDDVPVGLLRSHITNDVCRMDCLLVTKYCPNIEVATALMHNFVEYCRQNNVENCYFWLNDQLSEQIYFNAGFRCIKTKRVFCAKYLEEGESIRSKLWTGFDNNVLGLGGFKYDIYQNPGKMLLKSSIVATILFFISMTFNTAGGVLAIFYYPIAWGCYALDKLTIKWCLKRYRTYRVKGDKKKAYSVIWPSRGLAKAFSGITMPIFGDLFPPFTATIAFWILPIIFVIIPAG